jgi:inhibitor of cysteine peptidase
MQRHIHLFHVKIQTYILFLLIFSCSGMFAAMQDIPDEITVGQAENNGQVEVALGGVLILKLEANPGTGYSWKMVKHGAGLLKSMGEPIFEPISDEKEKRIGAPAYQTFRFRAQSAGTELIEMHYTRIWEKEAKPLKKFCVTVHVQ